MMSLRVVIALVACLGLSCCKAADYCSLCEKHTMCIYKDVGPQCEDVTGSGVSESEKQEIVDAHNFVRRKVATGKEEKGNPGSQPKAANLKKIVWDKELATVAQRWADQCEFGHDICRKDPRWEVGQNIYWESHFPGKKFNWTKVVLSWYSEVEQFNPKFIEKFSFNTATGHYTQVLWHDTYAIGCGRKAYGQESISVCNYGPSGNYIGSKLYEVGEPCSACPEGTTCEDSLCATTNLSPRTEDFSDQKINAYWSSNTIPQQDMSSRSSFSFEFPEKENKSQEGIVNIFSVDKNNDVELDEETKTEINNIHDQLIASAVPLLRIHDEITQLLKNTIRKCRQEAKNAEKQ